MLKGKTVLLGVSGSIAAYKIAYLASALKKLHADVHVLMTKNACNFITPVTFESLVGNKCLVDTFDRNFQFRVEHVSIASRADVLLVAPASANVIGKLAHGIADDMLTTTALACKCPKIVAPAMNTNMFENPVVQDNLKILEKYGWEVIAPATGYLACGTVGAGKMPEPEELLSYIKKEIAFPKDLRGKRILVTAGPTQEAIDPVRYITNHSTGKMGYALAANAMLRGAEVTLVTGKTALKEPMLVRTIPVTTAQEMFDRVTALASSPGHHHQGGGCGGLPSRRGQHGKGEKTDGAPSIALERTQDILKYLGEHRQSGQFLCGFSMETQNMLANAKEKLTKKNLDMIVANNTKEAGAGFGTDTNVVTMITRDEEISLPLLSKEETAARILDKIISLQQTGNP